MRVSIVEDNESDAKVLKTLLQKYAKDAALEIIIDVYNKPLEFLNKYKETYDVIFLDIEMPACDGIVTANWIRKLDSEVIIVFVTNMLRRAIDGYSVQAFDFVVKPISYDRLKVTLDMILRKLGKKQSTKIEVKTENGNVYLDSMSILYVEVAKHKLFFHMEDGRVLENWGSLTEIERTLSDKVFARCNSCYLVNLSFVKEISQNMVLVGEDYLKISRGKKGEFITKLMEYIE